MRHTIHRLVALFMLCLLVGCTASASKPAEPLPQKLTPPPSEAVLRQLSGQVSAWVPVDGPSGTAAQAGVPADAFRLGRPSRIALLNRDTIFQFAPGQSLRDQLQPTGGWLIPVYQNQDLVGLVELDDTYTPIGGQQQRGTSVFAGYDDPEAEVWYVPFTKYPPMILLSRPSGETMAPFHANPSTLYPAIAALGGQEVAPEVMLRTLADTITEDCRIFWVFWQC